MFVMGRPGVVSGRGVTVEAVIRQVTCEAIVEKPVEVEIGRNLGPANGELARGTDLGLTCGVKRAHRNGGRNVWIINRWGCCPRRKQCQSNSNR